MRSVTVWDLPTRVFHWLLVTAVTVAYATSELPGIFFTTHVTAGYLIAALLLFRVIWGFIGGRYARFADFLYGTPTIRRYASALMRLRPPRFVGHNPIGGWMVMALLVVVALTVSTGLFAFGEESGRGPFATFAGWAAGVLADLHGLLANAVVILAVVHVSGVLIDWLITGENLIRAMITGRKQVSADEAATEPTQAPRWLEVVIAGLVAATLVVALAATDFSTLRAAGNQHDSSSEDD